MNDKIFMHVVYAALLSTPRPYIYVKVVTRLIKMFVSYSDYHLHANTILAIQKFRVSQSSVFSGGKCSGSYRFFLLFFLMTIYKAAIGNHQHPYTRARKERLPNFYPKESATVMKHCGKQRSGVIWLGLTRKIAGNGQTDKISFS